MLVFPAPGPWPPLSFTWSPRWAPGDDVCNPDRESAKATIQCSRQQAGHAQPTNSRGFPDRGVLGTTSLGHTSHRRDPGASPFSRRALNTTTPFNTVSPGTPFNRRSAQRQPPAGRARLEAIALKANSQQQGGRDPLGPACLMEPPRKVAPPTVGPLVQPGPQVRRPIAPLNPQRQPPVPGPRKRAGIAVQPGRRTSPGPPAADPTSRRPLVRRGECPRPAQPGWRC